MSDISRIGQRRFSKTLPIIAIFLMLLGTVTLAPLARGASSTPQLVTTVPTNAMPGAMAFDPFDHNKNMYVATTAGTVQVISSDTNTIVATVPVGSGGSAVAYDPFDGAKDIFAANPATNTVYRIDSRTNTVVATIPVGSSPANILYAPSSHDLYVENDGSNTVSVID